MDGECAGEEFQGDCMKLPVILNNNYQIQDADGNLIAELWKNPKADEDGAKIVELLNEEYTEPTIGDEVMAAVEQVRSEGFEIAKKLSQSERMKEYWRKRKAQV